MRKSVLLLCVALVVCFATGMALAADKKTDRGPKTEAAKVVGKVVSLDDTKTSVTVTVKKEGKETEVIFTITDATKFAPEGKTAADLVKDAHVQVSYKPVETGNPTALTIKILPAETKAPHKAG